MGFKLYQTTSKYTKKSGMVPVKSLYTKIIFNDKKQVIDFLSLNLTSKDKNLRFHNYDNNKFELRYYSGSVVPQITYYECIETNIKQKLVVSLSQMELFNLLEYNKTQIDNNKKFWLYSDKIPFLNVIDQGGYIKYLVTIDSEILFGSFPNVIQNYLINSNFISSDASSLGLIDYVYNFSEISFSKGLIKKIERFDNLSINDDLELKQILLSKIK